MKNYNIINKSIDSALNNVPIGTAGDYVVLLQAPTAANVTIRINDIDADEIPLKAYHGFESSNVNKIFVSCNAVAGETIKIAQAKSAKQFKMFTPVTDIAVDEIGGYSTTALALLDKIANPHNITSETYITSTSTTTATMLNKTLTCDRVKIQYSEGYMATGQNGKIDISFDGSLLIAGNRVNDGSESEGKPKILELENVSGKTLIIQGANSSGRTHYAIVTEYTLKP